MKTWIRDVDGLLRGAFTRREDLEQGRITAPATKLVAAGLVLGAIYGLFMGLFAVLRPENPSWAQLFATTLKVPLLFLLTLLVTFPSLYVFSALARRAESDAARATELGPAHALGAARVRATGAGAVAIERLWRPPRPVRFA
jgi:hypothetical protein